MEPPPPIDEAEVDDLAGERRESGCTGDCGDGADGATLAAPEVGPQEASRRTRLPSQPQLDWISDNKVAFHLLREASTAVTSSLEPRAVVEAILIHALDLSGADDAHLFTYDGERLSFVAHRWRDGLVERRGPFKEVRDRGVTWQVARSGQTVAIPDVDQHPMFADWQWGGALIGLPLKARERVVGVMTLGFGRPRGFADGLLYLLELVADQAAVAHENARLHAQLKHELRDRRRAESRYRRLVDHLPTVICELDPDGTLTFVSPAISTVSGYQPQELIGRNWWDALYPVEWRAQVPRLYKLLDRGDITDHKMTLVDSSGETHVLSWSSANQWHPDGRLKRIIMIGADVTVRRRIEREREQLQEQLFFAQRMEGIGRLAGGVAHDFNNLLTAIQGWAYLLKESLEGERELVGDVEEIIHSAERGATLTRQILLYSRRDEAKPQVVNVNDVVGEVAQMLRRLIGEHITLQMSPAPRLPNVRIDPGHLEQVIVNLAVNARDAMSDRGTLRIATEVREMDEEVARRFTSLRPGPHVLLAISDTGCGMSPEVASRIFEPFFSTKPKGEGTGLGLSTVYGIVKQAHGSIGVQSVPGAGSTFEILLPVVPDRADSPRPSTNETPAVGRGETLLLVEDDESLRRPVVRFLSAHGYHVLEATDGDEGWEVYRKAESRIDLLVTDVVMPNLSGTELIDRVRRQNASLRILCISGFPVSLAARVEDDHPPVSFLWKPFSLRKLAARIRALLDSPPA